MKSKFDGEMNMKGGSITTNGGRVSVPMPKEYDKITLKIVPGEGIQQSPSVPLSKTKGMHGLLQRSSSEFDGFEDRIIPTGSKVINIGYLLAPSPSDSNTNSDQNDNITEIQPEKNMSVLAEFDIQKRRELDRLIQAQQEVDTCKAFNIKRRSLKDRLNEMSIDSFDHGIVPYKSATQNNMKVEGGTIDIHSYLPKTPESHDNESTLTDNDVINEYQKDRNISDTDLRAENNSDPNESYSDDDSDISSPDKSVESIVERFDAFLTDHGIAEVDLDILSPLAPTVSGDVLKAAALIDVIDDAIEDLAEKRISDTEEQEREEDCIPDEISFSDEVVTIDSPHEFYVESEMDINDMSSTQMDGFPSEETSYNNSSPNLSIITSDTPGSDRESELDKDEVIESPVKEHEGSPGPDMEEGHNGHMKQGMLLPGNRINGSVKPVEPELSKKSNLLKTSSNKRKKVNFSDPSSNEIILTYGPTEYDRANADIDPIASSAEWELEKRVDKMDVFSVDLQKDERGLGLSIIGLGVGTETGVEKLGIFVKTLTENGASQKDGRIQVNDQILEVNGTSLVGVTQYFAAQTLKNTDGIVRFLMGREKSCRTHYSPGATFAATPEMHKHIEEMNQVLQQLDETEERANNAENTLEDVKVELLKAEERAYKAEDELKDSREQLAVAAQSPFIGPSKKLKNEIKKNGMNVDTHRKLKELEIENERLQSQLVGLTEAIKVQAEKKQEMEAIARLKENAINLLEEDLSRYRTELESSNEKLSTLSEKNDYLQSLIVKLETKEESLTSPEEDIETKFLEKEEEYIKEAESLRARIVELEQQVAGYGTMLSDPSPVLPSRGYVSLRDVTDHVLPPQVSRNTKPCAKIEPSTRIPVEQQDESSKDLCTTDVRNNVSPNPIPKPERGRFVAQVNSSLDDNDAALTDEESTSDQLLYPIPNDTTSHVGGTIILPAVTGEKSSTKAKLALGVDLDDLPEGRIDGESGEDDGVDDEGQFELVCEEDIDEERETPHAVVSSSRAQLRLSSSLPSGQPLPDNLIADNTYNTFDKWLGGLDTISRDQQADIIAAHVAAGTPITRDYSNRSSLSSEDTPDMRSHLPDDHLEAPRSVDASVDMFDNEQPDSPEDSCRRFSNNLDTMVPPTQILENKSALDKNALRNNKRNKPSRSSHVVTPPESPKLDTSEPVNLSTLPRPPTNKKHPGKIKAAQSVPNLSFVPDEDGKTKRKHKYVFKLPIAFRKKKLGKRQESEEGKSVNVEGCGAGMSFSDPEHSPPPRVRTASDTALHTPGCDHCPSVVPIAEKAATLSQEKANDVATEEAVVPFADVEMIMNSHDVSSEKSSISGGCSPPSPDLHPESSPSISSRSLSNSRYENRLSSYPSNGTSDMEFSPSPIGSISPKVYNERGIDVDMTTTPPITGDYKQAPVTHWTFTQVGQWLSDTNMAGYVSAFRLHNVNGAVLLRADGRDLKDYGVHNQDHRAILKKHIKEFRNKFGKSPIHKTKEHKSAKDKLQFWKGKYKVNQ